MRCVFYTLAILLATTTLFADGLKPTKPETESIQGQWRPVSATRNGNEAPREDLGKSSITFSDDNFIGFGKRTFQGKFSLDQSTKPKQIDLTFQGENDATQVVKGIYRLQGDKLSLCTAAGPDAQRPAEFTSPAGENRTLLVLERMPGIVGKWERHAKNEAGQPHRIVKEHKAGKTTLTVYDEAGTIVYQHQSKYKLSRSGEIRIFTFFDMEATAGPDKGKKRSDTESYAYRINGDLFYEFRGVVLSDTTPPKIVVWKRVKK